MQSMSLYNVQVTTCPFLPCLKAALQGRQDETESAHTRESSFLVLEVRTALALKV